MSFSGSIAFLKNSSSFGKVIFHAVLVSTVPVFPEVRVLRLKPERPGKKPRGAAPVEPALPPTDQPPHPGQLEEGTLTVAEQDQLVNDKFPPGPPVTGENGSATLRLQSAPVPGPASVSWDLTVEMRVEKGVEIRLLARLNTTDTFEQVASLPSTSLVPAQINTNTAQTVRAAVKPVPRLCVGLTRATPPAPPASYRKFKQGSGDPSFPTAAVNLNAQDLRALLHRVFYLLDGPGTLDTVWDSEAGFNSSADLRAASRRPESALNAADELWARQVTEMLLGVPYDSPSNVYDFNKGKAKGPSLGDMPFCGGRLDSQATPDSNPIFGLVFACQHLATFGVLSRGLHKAKGQLGAGSMVSTSVVGMESTGGVKGQWLVNAASPTVVPPDSIRKQVETNPTVLTAEPNSIVNITKFAEHPDYGPGAVHLFSNAPAGPNDPAAYDALAAQVLANKDPKSKDRLTIKIPPAKARKFGPAPDARNPGQNLKDRFGANLRTEYRLSVSDAPGGKVSQYKQAQSLIFPALDVERDNQGGAHIGFALRVRNGKVQFFDTGGLNATTPDGKKRTDGVELLPSSGNGMHSGSSDDPLADRIESRGSSVRGCGVFGRLKESEAEGLIKHVQTVLKVARPMGLARLYLLKPDSLRLTNSPAIPLESVLFASKIKLTYDTNTEPDVDPDQAGKPNLSSLPSERNYPLSRYFWSLRDLPARAKVQAIWVIYAPTFPLAVKLVDAARTDTLTDILAESGADLLASTKVLRGCLSLPDGKVIFLNAEQLGPLTRLEGRQEPGRKPPPVLLPLETTLARFPREDDSIVAPPYFL